MPFEEFPGLEPPSRLWYTMEQFIVVKANAPK